MYSSLRNRQPFRNQRKVVIINYAIINSFFTPRLQSCLFGCSITLKLQRTNTNPGLSHPTVLVTRNVVTGVDLCTVVKIVFVDDGLTTVLVDFPIVVDLFVVSILIALISSLISEILVIVVFDPPIVVVDLIVVSVGLMVDTKVLVDFRVVMVDVTIVLNGRVVTIEDLRVDVRVMVDLRLLMVVVIVVSDGDVAVVL